MIPANISLKIRVPTVYCFKPGGTKWSVCLHASIDLCYAIQLYKYKKAIVFTKL